MPPAAGPPALTASCGTRRAGGAGAGQGCLSPEHPHRDPARAGALTSRPRRQQSPCPPGTPQRGRQGAAAGGRVGGPAAHAMEATSATRRLPCSRGPGVQAALGQGLRVQHKAHRRRLHAAWPRAPALPGDPRSGAPHQARTRAGGDGGSRPLVAGRPSATRSLTAAPATWCHEDASSSWPTERRAGGEGEARAGARAGAAGPPQTALWTGHGCGGPAAASKDAVCHFAEASPTRDTTSWPLPGQLGTRGCLCGCGADGHAGGWHSGAGPDQQGAEVAAAPM